MSQDTRILAVACPFCLAAAEQPCVTLGARTPREIPHSDRVRAARRAKPPAEGLASIGDAVTGRDPETGFDFAGFVTLVDRDEALVAVAGHGQLIRTYVATLAVVQRSAMLVPFRAKAGAA